MTTDDYNGYVFDDDGEIVGNECEECGCQISVEEDDGFGFCAQCTAELMGDECPG